MIEIFLILDSIFTIVCGYRLIFHVRLCQFIRFLKKQKKILSTILYTFSSSCNNPVVKTSGLKHVLNPWTICGERFVFLNFQLI